MEQHYGSIVKRFNWWSEREMLLNNLEALKRTAADMSLKMSQLQALYEEIEFNRADARSLRDKINRTALQFDLQPIPERQIKP